MRGLRMLLAGATAAAALVGAANAAVIVTPRADGDGVSIGDGQPVVPIGSDRDVTITFGNGWTFHYLLLIVDIADDSPSRTGTAVFSAEIAGGLYVSEPFAIDAGRLNLFEILAADGDAMTSLRVSGDVAFDKIDLIQVGGTSGGNGSPVPEPSMVGLIGAGIVGVGGLRRKRILAGYRRAVG